MRRTLTRRQLLVFSTVIGTGTLIAACGTSAATTTSIASSTAGVTNVPEPTKLPEPTASPTVHTGSVPRNRTLMINSGGVGGKYTWVGLINPCAGMNAQEGGALLWSPLFYYSVFADKEIPWVAESGIYNADYTTLTIRLRKGVEWSDGQPVTSRDVKWMIDMQTANGTMPYYAIFNEFVEAVATPDDATVLIRFKSPQPRFKFENLSFKFDTGYAGYVLPAHYFEAKNVGMMKVQEEPGTDMPTNGMYKVTMSPEQLIYDLREDWWGFKTGFQKIPEVKRVIFIPLSDTATAAQRVVNNECDTCSDLRPTLIRTAVRSNPKITTHTGKDEPLGYIDWWPNLLWMNDSIAPYSSADVRWALNYAIDRDTLDKIVFLGAKIATVFPYPEYPALKKYLDPARPLADKLGVRKFNLEDSAKRMRQAGFIKDADGYWVKDGKRVNATIHGFEAFQSDIVPILVEMLRRGGFEAAINFGNDAGQNMVDGVPGLYLCGLGGSVLDPYTSMECFHSRNAKPNGTMVDWSKFSRYRNPDLDKIIDNMVTLAPGDPKLNELFMKAIEIYWTDMISIPIIQWLHRIPYNTTYWTNWPTQDNPYLNGAFWHLTFPLIVLSLKPAQ